MTDPFEQTRRMQALVGELWRLEGPKVENHVGDVAWQRFQHAGREGEWRIRLWEEDGEPVAWAWVRRPAMLQHEIHPRHRGGALHEELLDWFEAEVDGDELRVSSLSTDTERLAFLRSRGYEVDPEAREFVYHACELSDVAEPVVPEGYRLRTVESDDLEQRVELHRVVWAPSRVTVESFVNVQAAWPYRPDLDCVVEAPDGSFAAYCLAWLDPTTVSESWSPSARIPTTGGSGWRQPCAASPIAGCAKRAPSRRSSTPWRAPTRRALRVDRHARARPLDRARQATQP